ncbi:MAG: pitrilysin family protein [Armatimonadota bacterium]|nr:insulinase family protein [Armatimonadota bacterium]MCX7776676.1 insulinase family protein [Armatimonadota bacterium]MDW8025709.1 pitrilysin family protein [Armatimonadota bacterium]
MTVCLCCGGNAPCKSVHCEPAVHVLGNGVTVIAIEKRNHPSVTICGSVKAGSVRDEPNMRGLANMTSQMLTKGTVKRTWVQIAEELEDIGARIWTWCAYDFAGFGVECLSRYVERSMDVLADVLLNPSFPHEELEKCKLRTITLLRTREDDPWAVAAKMMRQTLYPSEHPYKHLVEGEEDSILRVDNNALLEFHSRWYRPNGAAFAVVGDIAPEEAFKLAERYFGGWEAGSNEVETLKIADVQLQPPRFEVRTMVDKSQVAVMLGQICVSRRDPDYYALNVFNCILGGSAGIGRLFNRVRGIEGLAYSVWSRILGQWGKGMFIAGAGVDPANVRKAIDSIRKQVAAICGDEPPSAVELSDAVNYIVGGFNFRIETNSGMAQAVLDAHMYELGVDYLRKREEIYRSITLEQVIETARRHINVDSLSTVVAGPWSEHQ